MSISLYQFCELIQLLAFTALAAAAGRARVGGAVMPYCVWCATAAVAALAAATYPNFKGLFYSIGLPVAAIAFLGFLAVEGCRLASGRMGASESIAAGCMVGAFAVTCAIGMAFDKSSGRLIGQMVAGTMPIVVAAWLIGAPPLRMAVPAPTGAKRHALQFHMVLPRTNAAARPAAMEVAR